MALCSDLLDRVVKEEIENIISAEEDSDSYNGELYGIGEAPSTKYPGIPGRISWARKRMKVIDLKKSAHQYPKGKHHIYTIYGKVWDDKRKRFLRRPLYVGMAKGSSVAARVDDRLKNKSFRNILKKHKIKKNDLDVGIGKLTNGSDMKPDMKLLHVYELLLQRKLLNTKWHRDNRLFNQNVWTFEDLEEMNFEGV